MRSIAVVLFLAATASFLGISPLLAQAAPGQIGVQGHVGYALPTGDLEDSDGGIAFGALLDYTLTPGLALVAGYDRALLERDREGGATFSGHSDLYRAGGRFTAALAPAFAPYLQAALGVGRIRSSAREGGSRFTVDSDWGVGFDIEAGGLVPLQERLSVVPSVRYTQYRTGYEEGVLQADGDATYVTIGIGVRYGL